MVVQGSFFHGLVVRVDVYLFLTFKFSKMKKKIFYYVLSFFSILTISTIDFSTSFAQTGATCYSSDMYFCRGCTVSGGRLNYKQVTLCTPIDPVEIAAETN
ncbi:MAG: hypothetical protein DSY77_03030 [Bacteroidetes bacterium]|nr:MAG: hypothetical protein DSY77_03030 [Bacteroidota bacterium]